MTTTPSTSSSSFESGDVTPAERLADRRTPASVDQQPAGRHEYSPSPDTLNKNTGSRIWNGDTTAPEATERDFQPDAASPDITTGVGSQHSDDYVENTTASLGTTTSAASQQEDDWVLREVTCELLTPSAAHQCPNRYGSKPRTPWTAPWLWLSLSNLCDRMIETDTQIAVACDPYRPKGRMPSLPAGFTAFACKEDPAVDVLVRRPPFDLCPVMISKHVVGVYGQSRDSHFTIVSVYAPPHKPMDSTLRAVLEVVSRSPYVIVAGDFNAKHRAWGPRAGDERGAQVMEVAAAAGLLVMNDPQSEPTYETPYAASWIDLTLATTSVLTSGYTWTVRSDVTHSEHKSIVVRIGPDDEGGARKRLTRYAQQELSRALEREPFFARVVLSQPRSPEALDYILGAFYGIFEKHLRRHLRPVSSLQLQGYEEGWDYPVLPPFHPALPPRY
ncbi:hypothetical protein HPB50_011533 [Hyalomma asiaticum]|uniref:Uncharacterized protein n=1 Tax=Hyalomma asiaticum TaxID=266040 RepID=A0ACB7T7J3_HYAAI|nr:hypothetical protein HPB50_011533 [Hyalomma asiaticum]